MEPLHWILSLTGAGGIVTAIGVNASRKKDAAKDRAERKADREQRAEDAAKDRAERKADREQRAAEAADARQGTQALMASLERQGAALTEILRRTAPPSPPSATEDKPDTTANPNPGTGQHGADGMGADRAAGLARTDEDKPTVNGAYLSIDTLNALFETDDEDTWMTLLGPFLWEREAPVSADAAEKAIQARTDAAAPDHPDRDLGPKIIAFIRDAEAGQSTA